MASSCAHRRLASVLAARSSSSSSPALSRHCLAARRLASSSSPGKKQPARGHHKPLPYHARPPLPSSLASSPAAAASIPKSAPAAPDDDAASSSSAAKAAPGSSGAQPVDQLFRSRWIAIFGAGAAALCLGSFTASLWVASADEAPVYVTGREPSVPTGRPAIQSPVEFDLHLDKSEWRSGITALRRRLAAAATGHVLEVAFGAGRNVEFYDWGAAAAAYQSPAERTRDKLRRSGWGATKLADVPEMASFTGQDISPAMLDLGLRRLRQSLPPHAGLRDALPETPAFARLAAAANNVVELLDGRLRVCEGDAQLALPPPPAGVDKYDTIVQTFGLCSVRDPVLLLRNMAAAVAPGTGRIVLLEHGRSWWDLVNRMLDRSARGHFERFGCWWNRDIERVVRDAQAQVPGLELVALERPGWTSFGTHVWVELRVRPSEPARGGADDKADEGQGAGGFWALAGKLGFPSK